MAYVLTREIEVDRPLEYTFFFFSDPQKLNDITPPWLYFRILNAPAESYERCVIRYRLQWHGVPLIWTAEISQWEPPCRFVDRQIHGPYSLWVHTHEFRAAGRHTIVSDTVEYALPLGRLGRALHAVLVKRDVQRIFNYREQRIGALLNPDGN